MYIPCIWQDVFPGTPTVCTYCVGLFSCMLDVVFFDCINFILQFCEMFYNVPAWGPVRKHFIFYILNIYVCTWLVCIVHIHRHRMQRPLWRWPVVMCVAVHGCPLLPFPVATDLPRGQLRSPPGGAALFLRARSSPLLYSLDLEEWLTRPYRCFWLFYTDLKEALPLQQLSLFQRVGRILQ